MEPFGNPVPYAEPAWYQGYASPHTPAHAAFRLRCRQFVEAQLCEKGAEWEAACAGAGWDKPGGPDTAALSTACAEAGLLPGLLGEEWPSEYTAAPAPEGWDLYAAQILIDELSRAPSGVACILMNGRIIGGRPVLSFGSRELKARVLPSVLDGSENICLGMSEPHAGSDVAALRAAATRDGDTYLVTGQKKWITCGVFSRYMTTAVRTGGVPGAKGVSMVVVDLKAPGASAWKMPCSGLLASGTTFVELDEVRVPVANRLGDEGAGFAQLMYNLNHERWYIANWAMRQSRIMVEDSVKHAVRRKTMGKALSDHQAIRMKLAEMGAKVHSTAALLEDLTAQMHAIPAAEQPQKLGGLSAMVKVACCRCFEFCAREASQVLGGISYVQGGAGDRVERAWREVRAFSIFGGSEEVMMDLVGKQMLKQYHARL